MDHHYEFDENDRGNEYLQSTLYINIYLHKKYFFFPKIMTYMKLKSDFNDCRIIIYKIEMIITITNIFPHSLPI